MKYCRMFKAVNFSICCSYSPLLMIPSECPLCCKLCNV
ncbi:hypothetical protein BCN_3711 [Bacillus cereus NC7401]|nr:hypothetical protein BCN_3711 [Bacillus cereus NC7401]